MMASSELGTEVTWILMGRIVIADTILGVDWGDALDHHHRNMVLEFRFVFVSMLGP